MPTTVSTPADLTKLRAEILAEVDARVAAAVKGLTPTSPPPVVVPPVVTPPVVTPPVVAGERAGAGNTGPRIGQLTASAADTVAAGTTVTGVRFTKPVKLYGKAVDCQFDSWVLMLGADPSLSWCAVNGLSISSAKRPRVSNVEVTGGGGDLMHITSDQRATAPFDMVTDAVLDTVWAHRTQAPAQGAHVDGLQVRGVAGLTLRNCVIDLGPWAAGPDGADALNAALFLESANGGNADVTVDNCLLNGGGITMRYAGIVGGKFEVTDTDLGPDFRYAQQYKTTDRPATTAPTKQTGNRQQSATGTWSPLTLI